MEYPHLQEIYARRGGDDFTILSIETTNRPELAKKFADEIGARFPILLDENKQARTVYGLQGVPTNLLIDRQGRVVFRHLGFSKGQEKILDAEIQYLLDQKTETSELIRN